ncbi:hypothetical protein B0H16DRAFT_1462596 [Mycena metata]|uniref:Uncharacterized protein n=1 Tax=Mycena metata TaxID=1033252 RepID=A0AAD7INN5_9AGAR|nr:hypothetical protein B0H16DRAFT_1462596 [Mycena metata]
MAHSIHKDHELAVNLIALFLYLVPIVIEAYYPEAAPIAAVFIWVTDSFEKALSCTCWSTSSAISVVASGAPHRRKPAQTGAARVATPAELEAGVALNASDEASSPQAGTTPPSPNSSRVSEMTLTEKLVFLAFCTYILVGSWSKDDVLSLERSALDNALSTLMYIFHGLEVGFAMSLALRLWTKLKLWRSASAVGADATLPTATAPESKAQPPAVEMLFDEGGKEEYLETEKA